MSELSRRRVVVSLTALLASHTISRTGNVVALFSLPFWVLANGGDAIQVGLAAAAASAPIVIGGPLGSVLVDRIGYVRSIVVADVVSGATIALIPLLAATVGLPFPALLALVFVGGLLDAPGETARRVILPELSTVAGIRLERSVGFLDSTTRLSTLIGAPLAGVLVATIGPLPVFGVTAAAFAVSAAVSAAFVRRPASEAVEPAPETKGYWSDLREGLRFVTRDPLLRLIVALVLVTNMLDAARSGTLLPLYAVENLGGAAALGLISAAFGGAALLGSLVFGFIAHRVPRRITFSLCFVVAGAGSLVGPTLGLTLPWLVVGAAVGGLGAGALNPILGAVELERTPVALRARVLGVITAGAWLGIPLGGLLGGAAAATIGVGSAFAIALVVYVLITLTPLLGGSWRLMERTTITQDRAV